MPSLAELKFAAFCAAAAAIFFAGWHLHSWYDGYKKANTETAAIKNLGEGEGKIITFNQDFDKEKASDKDLCVDKPHPAYIGKLLR
jgi:hypothetical protein